MKTNETAPKRQEKRSAFTLLEIMTVVVIIGIVAGMAVMVMDPGATADKARRDTTAAKIGSAMNAVKLYKIQEGKTPSGWEQLKSAGYIKEIPKDAWGNPLTMSKGVITSTAGGESGAKPISSADLEN